MTHALLAVRIVSSLASVWAYVAFRRQTRRELTRQAIANRLDSVIRG